MPFSYWFLMPFWGLAEVIRLTESHFAELQKPGRVQFRFQVGLDGAGPHVPYGMKPLSDAGGDLPDVRLWTEVGDFAGSAIDPYPRRVQSGTITDVRVYTSHAVQPSYVLLSGNENAICLAMMTARWSDHQAFAWNGDWAHMCNHPWYYSNVLLNARPLKCAWIDKNGEQPVTGIALHLPSFKLEDEQDIPPLEPFCAQNPIQTFRYDHDPRDIGIWGQPDRPGEMIPISGVDKNMTRNAKPKNRRPKRWESAQRIVRSTKKEHSARELCASESSHGPDMVSFEEGTFCDMDSRQVYDLCTSEESVDCFDAEERVIRASKSGIMKRGEPIQKVYSQVLEW